MVWVWLFEVTISHCGNIFVILLYQIVVFILLVK